MKLKVQRTFYSFKKGMPDLLSCIRLHRKKKNLKVLSSDQHAFYPAGFA